MKGPKVRSLVFCLILTGAIVLCLPRAAFLKDSPAIVTQGLINPGDHLKAGYILVNEMRIYLNASTQIMDHRGGPLKATDLKPKKWVYLELEKDRARNILKARKIYLLPHYVGADKKKQYAFMK